jgi:hypothetical protein
LDDPACGDYMAVSYTWGSPFPEDYQHCNSGLDYVLEGEQMELFVLCNGGRIRCTKNLHACLRQSAIANEPAVWIDALCIN